MCFADRDPLSRADWQWHPRLLAVIVQSWTCTIVIAFVYFSPERGTFSSLLSRRLEEPHHDRIGKYFVGNDDNR